MQVGGVAAFWDGRRRGAVAVYLGREDRQSFVNSDLMLVSGVLTWKRSNDEQSVHE